ncbi:MAG: P63C domain-containing protein [Deltaproteobacteria bacterium]|nr:P63C domain-containing protein [Deltaproteobacteria bacterium]
MTESVITHTGHLRLGPISIPCFVTNQSERLIASRKMQESLKIVEESPDGSGRPGTRLKRFLTGKFFNSLIKNDNVGDLFEPVRRKYKGQMIAGFKAEALTKLCELMIEAERNGLLRTGRQRTIATQASIFHKAFAKVGLTALIDEATGYQKDRPHDELQVILAAYISAELLPWTRRFPTTFYEEMFRLRNWKYPDDAKIRGPRGPRYAGKITRDLIYKQLPPGVLEELETKNPPNEKWQRKYRHPQLLSENIGNPHLEKQVAVVTALMRGAPNWRAFMRLFNRNFPHANMQVEMDIDVEESEIS